MRLATLLLSVLIAIVSASSRSNYGSNNRYSSRRDDDPFDNGNSRQEDTNKDILQEREQLYEAYNLLHTLAQDFHKPFDAPAVIVVGHQTSGKSALIEALMGFQFNQVGGGTKTRRPIALRMQYNPTCTSPLCFLTLENGKEEQRSLADIQAYIEAENRRLERDSTRSFDPREINIRMEYKYCPNMIVIDTPGMLHAPKGRQLTPQQRALANAAREAESLVLNKIRCQDYIILCVEDTTDWKHATTRNVVMQADPQFTRTVLVTTKLDTKLPQFSEPEDLEDFLKAPLVRELYSQIMGGPFFTSVPSGRVGLSRDYDTNEAFVHALRTAEKRDRTQIMSRVGQMKAKSTMQNVGVSKLRTFLEARVEDCYRRNVAKIVPLLQSELRHTEMKLEKTEAELNALSVERLKQSANLYRERFSKELLNALQGSIKASPEEFGETLDAEQMKGGSFLHQDQVQSDAWSHILENEIGNTHHKLFGGAQYHRAIKEFTLAVRHMKAPGVTENEIANAAGMGDTHNGVNFMRAACVIAMEKAQESFDPILEALRHRAVHIMRRLFHVVESMTRKGAATTPVDSYNQPLEEMIQRIYEKFVDEKIADCLLKCRDDLNGMTRFVTWDVEDKGGSSTLYRLLPTPKKMVEIYSIAIDKKKVNTLPAPAEEDDVVLKREDPKNNKNKNNKNNKNKPKNPAEAVVDQWSEAYYGSEDKQNLEDGNSKQEPVAAADAQANNGALTVANQEEDAELTDYYRVMQLTEEMLSGSSVSRTSALVTSLVQYIIICWRNHFARSTAMKFNCFFLMPFMDEFPIYLRNELDKIYESGVAEMFDISQARKALQATRAELIAECDANSKLQLRFDQISAQLKKSYPSSGSSDSADPLSAPEDEEVFEDEDDFDGNDFNDAPSFSSERFYRSNNLDSYGNRDNYGSRQPSRDRAPISASSRLDSSARDDRYSRGTKSVDPPTPQRPRQYTAEKPTAERPSNFANSRRATTPRRSNYYDQNKETEQPQSAAARRLSARRAASRTSQSTSNAAEVEASGPLVDDVTVRGNRSPPRFNRRSKLEELDDLFDDSVSAVQPEEYNDEYDSVDPSIEEPEIKR